MLHVLCRLICAFVRSRSGRRIVCLSRWVLGGRSCQVSVMVGPASLSTWGDLGVFGAGTGEARGFGRTGRELQDALFTTSPLSWRVKLCIYSSSFNESDEVMGIWQQSLSQDGKFSSMGIMHSQYLYANSQSDVVASTWVYTQWEISVPLAFCKRSGYTFRTQNVSLSTQLDLHKEFDYRIVQENVSELIMKGLSLSLIQPFKGREMAASDP